MFNKISDTSKKMMLVSIALFIIILGINFILIKGVLLFEMVIGLVLGTACVLLKLYMIDTTTQKMLNLSPIKGQNYSKVQYLIRYFLSLIVLIISIVLSKLIGQSSNVLFGTALGLCLLPISGFIVGFSIKTLKK